MHRYSLRRIAGEIKSIVCFLIVLPFALVRRHSGPDIWLVSERYDQARDNGYCFFRFMKEKHPEQKVCYLIDKKGSDYFKIKKDDSVIQFNSLLHYYYYCRSSIQLSAHTGGCNPSNATVCRALKRKLGIKFVFLPHGVSYGITEFCLKKYARIDLFICSGKLEYENVLKYYGYDASEVAYTGYPRLDDWHGAVTDQKQILLMPTWRTYLAKDDNIPFESTVYFKTYQSLIRNKKLTAFLEEKDLKLVFYLHNNMQKYADCFSCDSRNIEIVSDDSKYDIQELLKSAALLITDYSSVHFDFAYMNKPVIYYQFDQDEFFIRQYQKGMFDTEEDGFGPVAFGEDRVVEELIASFKNSFAMSRKYYGRMRNFYQLYDSSNCERVYMEIRRHFC